MPIKTLPVALVPALRLLLLFLIVARSSTAAAAVQGAAYNESLAKLGAVWSSIAYGPPVRSRAFERDRSMQEPQSSIAHDQHTTQGQDDVAAGIIYNDTCRALLPGFRIVRTYHSRARDGFGFIGVSDVERLVLAAFKGDD